MYFKVNSEVFSSTLFIILYIKLYMRFNNCSVRSWSWTHFTFSFFERALKNIL